MDEDAGPRPLTFRLATHEDASRVVALVNGAYRGDGDVHGWTDESTLVTGQRIDEAGFLKLLEREGSDVLLAERNGRVVGCVRVEDRSAGECHVGLLAVDVRQQRTGVGRSLLAHAEDHARERYGATTMSLRFVNRREDLLRWYEDRGYRRTGDVEPFPDFPGISFPKGRLYFERMEKDLA